ncbi:MAG TPA: glycoside hydrolase family 140 protein [Terriglobia bacterium]|nr:glycoside hydrolase family 140 protein [Terriglobia bacterium]
MQDLTRNTVRGGKRILVATCAIGVLLGTVMGKGQSPSVVTQLSPSANKRYLVDQSGTAFLLQGDAAWSLIVGLPDAEVEQYLKNRRQKGFNTIIVELIEHKFCKKPPLNEAGDAPFTTPGDFSTPNEKYFAHADWVIRKAGEYGMQVLLVPIYLGYKGTDEGWIEELLKLEPEKCLAYGRYLGKRYKDFDNIIWVMGGDRNPETALEKVDLIALGIREFDQRHLFTAHCHPENSAADQYTGGKWLDINTTYSYEIIHSKLLGDYNRTPTLPFFLIESAYEGEHNSSEVQIRRQAYWSVLCGGFGHVMGNNPIWHFDGPGLFPAMMTWQQAMDLPGSVGMMYWGRLFRSRAWFDLVPDHKHEVVTGGLGEFTGLDYLAAARTSDGSTVIAYLPSKRTISVDMSKVSGAQTTGWWFDPRTGRATAAGDFPTSGSQELTPSGEGDWVLVLDDASKNRLPPGTSP